MDNSTLKPKSHKNINDTENLNLQNHIRPKPRTKRKAKQHSSSVDLQQNRGLFSAISESSMCYPLAPLPSAIPIDHHPSVSFLPIYQPPCCSSYQCCHHKPQPIISSNTTNKKLTRDSNKYLNCLNGNDSFTSLPPAIPLNSEDSPTRRRFSDPGLGNDDISITSDETREADDVEELADLNSMDFEEELIVLKKDYCKLNRDLSKTRKELALLKNIVQNQNVHSPLLITDIITEIQSAADMREDAFIARVQSLVDQSNANLTQAKNKDCSCHNVLSRLESVEHQIKQMTISFNQKSSNVYTDLNHDNMVNHTGYISSNGLNPFEYEDRSSSPSTEL